MEESADAQPELATGFTFPVELPTSHGQSLPSLVAGSVFLTGTVILLAVAIYTRRMPRFSLRSMFVIVTLLCIWFGWETKVIAERNAALRLVEERGYRVDEDDSGQLPLIRRMLGDRAVTDIFTLEFHDERLSPDEIEELKSLFGEECWRGVGPPGPS